MTLTSLVGTGMGASTSLTSSTPTLTWACNKGMLWMVVDPSQKVETASWVHVNVQSEQVEYMLKLK